MAEEKLEGEVLEVINNITSGNNFLLSGGAGSGKTYSLVQIITSVIKEYPKAQIACMTYTNAVVKEIEERVNHDCLRVSTIHDFLWENIKQFQNELKKAILTLSKDETSKIKFKNQEEDEKLFIDSVNKIQYKEYIRLREGIISHDEIIELSNYMFKNYPLLCSILKDKYKFIFIDEYQDTNSLVVEIFLNHLKNSGKKNIIGFFGDSMQSIYENGIGDLKEYIFSNDVKEVIKKQNRRNPKLVIDLANKLRTDSMVQEPSEDKEAPNMLNGVIKKGEIKFLYSQNSNIDRIKNTEYFSGWDFNNSKETKELNLTHNLIAPRAGFSELMNVYDKDPILKIKSDIVAKIKAKDLVIDETKSFDTIVDLINSKGLFKKSQKEIINSSPEIKMLYDQLKDIPFVDVKKIYYDKDALIDDKKQDEDEEKKKGSKRDNLIKHLFKIEEIISNYKEGNYNEFIRKTEYKIDSIRKKIELKTIIDTIKDVPELTIDEIINFCDKNGICKKDEKLEKFIVQNKYLFDRVKKLKYKEFQNLFYYLEGYTPFSSQHKIKGAEFDNVLVIMDNGGWSSYNFEYLFCNRTDKENVLLRTQKIFYVCCTRAKEKLAIFYHMPSATVIDKAKEWFGVENVICLDN